MSTGSEAPQPPGSPWQLGVGILAAGASSRMGRPKLLLPWGETSILGHHLDQWRSLEATQIAVVCSAADPAVQGELARLHWPPEQRILNPAPERGMFSSVQCAAIWTGWMPDLTHLAIVLGDQPQLRSGTLRVLLAFARTRPDSVCQPGRNGRRRHPIILPRAVLRQLALTSAPDLKQFLAAVPVEVCELDDPGLDLDIDRPEDYEKALRLFVEQRS